MKKGRGNPEVVKLTKEQMQAIIELHNASTHKQCLEAIKGFAQDVGAVFDKEEVEEVIEGTL